MSDSEPTLAEVYESLEFQEYSLILDEEEAYYYRETSFSRKRQREALVAGRVRTVHAPVHPWREKTAV